MSDELGSARDEKWVVTGASRGLGRAFALALARQGADLLLAGRDAEALATVAAEARELGAKDVTLSPGDLATSNAAHELAQRALDAGPIDGVINNAGFGLDGDVIDQSVDRLMTMIGVNVGALMILSRKILPAMISRQQGRLLQVSSIAGFTPVPTEALYAATKSWVLSFTTALAVELRNTGVTATALCPGLTRTEFFATAGMKTNSRIADHGSWKTPEEVARIGLRAAQRGKVVVVPGLRNRALVSGLEIMPRCLTRTVTRWLVS